MILIYFFIFSFGLIIGSFLNVVIDRWGTGQGLGGRSKCDSTGKTLKWFELIPVLSFLMQKGRSRYSKALLSIQYPLVEISAGFVFLFMFQKFWYVAFKNPPAFMYLFLFHSFVFCILIVIFAYDLKHKIIPNYFVWMFNLLALFNVFMLSPTPWNFLAGPLVAIPIFLLWFISGGRWIGFGDVKYSLGMGWFLGVSAGFFALILSFWIGAIIGIFLLIIGRKKDKPIPFAPFLVLATFLVFLYNIDMSNLINLLTFY